MNRIARGIQVIDAEIAALEQLKASMNNNFNLVLETLDTCTGKIIVTGVGKSGHIARKIAATMASLGTSAFFVHPDDALHGDLGMISDKDVVIAISNSGESDELVKMLPGIKTIGARLIAITHNAKSTLANNSDILCLIPKVKEACILGIAPTSSTTVTLALGDALAVTLSDMHHFKEQEYAVFHPSGSLGKRLTTRVTDIMRSNNRNAVIPLDSYLKDALAEIGKKEMGAVMVADEDGHLLGLITDGDLRRCMEKELDIYSTGVGEIMTRKPITIHQNDYIISALKIMREAGKKCSVLPVIDDDKLIKGIVCMSDILRLGIVY